MVGTPFEDRDAVTLDRLEHLARVEARDEHEAGARHHRRVQRAGLPEGVKQRERAEHHVVGRRAENSPVITPALRARPE